MSQSSGLTVNWQPEVRSEFAELLNWSDKARPRRRTLSFIAHEKPNCLGNFCGLVSLVRSWLAVLASRQSLGLTMSTP